MYIRIINGIVADIILSSEFETMTMPEALKAQYTEFPDDTVVGIDWRYDENTDGFSKVEPDPAVELRQEREDLLLQLDAIHLREITLNMIYGGISDSSPITALFADTEPVLSDRDGIIQRIKEIDGILNGG